MFKRRIGRSPYFKAFARTNFVCARGPSPASTTKIAPSTMPTTRSTYPPHHKSYLGHAIFPNIALLKLIEITDSREEKKTSTTI